MALKIKNKAGIRDTFDARPDLKEVHILENGDHYFTKLHAEHAGRKKTEGEGEAAKQVLDEKITTLGRDAAELKEEAEKPAK